MQKKRRYGFEGGQKGQANEHGKRRRSTFLEVGETIEKTYTVEKHDHCYNYVYKKEEIFQVVKARYETAANL